ncbi:hypothetical protein AB3S75_029503 [Citrus x aurantiifolia]
MMENSSLSAPLIVPDTNEQQQINDKLGHVQDNNIEAAGRRLGNYDANNYSGNTSFFKTCFNGFNALSGNAGCHLSANVIHAFRKTYVKRKTPRLLICIKLKAIQRYPFKSPPN